MRGAEPPDDQFHGVKTLNSGVPLGVVMKNSIVAHRDVLGGSEKKSSAEESDRETYLTP